MAKYWEHQVVDSAHVSQVRPSLVLFDPMNLRVFKRIRKTLPEAQTNSTPSATMSTSGIPRHAEQMPRNAFWWSQGALDGHLKSDPAGSDTIWLWVKKKTLGDHRF